MRFLGPAAFLSIALALAAPARAQETREVSSTAAGVRLRVPAGWTERADTADGAPRLTVGAPGGYPRVVVLAHPDDGATAGELLGRALRALGASPDDEPEGDVLGGMEVRVAPARATMAGVAVRMYVLGLARGRDGWTACGAAREGEWSRDANTLERVLQSIRPTSPDR